MRDAELLVSRVEYGKKRIHYTAGLTDAMRGEGIAVFTGMHSYPRRIMSTEARAKRLGIEIDMACIPAWVASGFCDWIYPLYWIVRPERLRWDPTGLDELKPDGIAMYGLPDEMRK